MPWLSWTSSLLAPLPKLGSSETLTLLSCCGHDSLLLTAPALPQPYLGVQEHPGCGSCYQTRMRCRSRTTLRAEPVPPKSGDFPPVAQPPPGRGGAGEPREQDPGRGTSKGQGEAQ